MSLNKVILIGNLGADPDINFLPSGEPVMNFSLATSLRRKNKDTGERVTETEWHRITVYGKLAETTSQLLGKGRQTYVEGRLRTRKWTDKEGVVRYTTEIIANDIQVVGPARAPAGE